MKLSVANQIDILRGDLQAHRMTLDEAIAVVVNDIGGFTPAGARDVLTDYRSATSRYTALGDGAE